MAGVVDLSVLTPEDEQLIKEVKDDDDLDMTKLGKPTAAFKPSSNADGKQASENTEDSNQQPKADEGTKKKKKKKKDAKATEAMWSQLDQEIADVSDGSIEDMPINTAPSGMDGKNEDGTAGSPTKRGMMPGGLSGGQSLGSNAPLKEGPKDHSYDIVNGEAKARVYDTPELRAAFLHYCNSSIKVTEMHLVHEGPFMAAQQFVQMCKEYKLLEPEGKLSGVMVGIIYTTSKSDDDEGLAFGQFLDSLVSLAFECETNVAAALQSEWDKKDVLNKKAEGRSPVPRRASVAMLRSTNSATGGPEEQLGSPKTADGAPSLLMSSPSRLRAPIDDPEAFRVRKEPKTRFQSVENLTQSSVLDKVNEVSKIKSMATSRATSVINSRVTSRMVSQMPSRRGSQDGTDSEAVEGDVSPKKALFTCPGVLTTHVHAALEGYEGYAGEEDNGPKSPGALSPRPSRPQSFTSALHPHVGATPGSPLGHTSNLRPTTAQKLRSNNGAAEGPACINNGSQSPLARKLPRDLVNKGFGDDGDDDEDEAAGRAAQKRAAAGLLTAVRDSGNGAAEATSSEDTRPSLKSALAGGRKKEAAFGSPVGSMRVRISENGTTVASRPTAPTDAEAVEKKKEKKKSSKSDKSEKVIEQKSSEAVQPASNDASLVQGTETVTAAEKPDKASPVTESSKPEKPKQRKTTPIDDVIALVKAEEPQSLSRRNSETGNKPIWRPSMQEGMLSGRLKIDPNLARVGSGRKARSSSTGEGVPSPSPAADTLKTALFEAESPTVSNPEHLPVGEQLSPKPAKPSKSLKADEKAAGTTGNPEKAALEASFGKGIAAGGGAAEKKAADDDAAAAKKKKRAEMEAKLAAIEQRNKSDAAGSAKPKAAPGALTSSKSSTSASKKPSTATEDLPDATLAAS